MLWLITAAGCAMYVAAAGIAAKGMWDLDRLAQALKQTAQVRAPGSFSTMLLNAGICVLLCGAHIAASPGRA